jgi:hypothetical protein
VSLFFDVVLLHDLLDLCSRNLLTKFVHCFDYVLWSNESASVGVKLLE